jgi:hypothetical protein
LIFWVTRKYFKKHVQSKVAWLKERVEEKERFSLQLVEKMPVI